MSGDEGKSLFRRFVYDPGKDSSTTTPVPRSGVRPPGVVNTNAPIKPAASRVSRVTTSGRPVTFDPEYFETILQRIGTDVQLPDGFDQLIQMLITLEEKMSGSTLVQRFDIALGTVGALSGITKEQVIRTLQKQQEIVLKLRGEFEKSIVADAEAQRGQHSGEIQSLEELIEQLKEQIANLEKEKSAKERELSGVRDSLKGIDTQLENDRAAFNATCVVIQQGAPQQKWIGIDVLLDVINPANSGGDTHV